MADNHSPTVNDTMGMCDKDKDNNKVEELYIFDDKTQRIASSGSPTAASLRALPNQDFEATW